MTKYFKARVFFFFFSVPVVKFDCSSLRFVRCFCCGGVCFFYKLFFCCIKLPNQTFVFLCKIKTQFVTKSLYNSLPLQSSIFSFYKSFDDLTNAVPTKRN